MTMGITSPTSTTGQILKNGSAVISFDANNNATFAGNVAPSVNPTMRNRIINGAMVIDQRNAGASVTATTTNPTYTLDRWAAYFSQNSKYTVQQNAASVTPPAGFTNYLGVTSSSAYTVLAGDYFAIGQSIEGYNVADLAWGTANAKTITFSFWVRSSLTGTFGGALQNSAYSRTYPFSYTISAANTWEQKTVTVTGDTSGTWLTTNGVGIRFLFGLGAGSTYGSGTAGAWSSTESWNCSGATSVVGTNGATFYITGVQLEVGSVATPFEQRLYGQELALCQRYYYNHVTGGGGYPVGMGSIYTASIMLGYVQFPVTMRTTPTISATSGTDYWTIYRNGGSDQFNSLVLDCAYTSGYSFKNTTEIASTAGQAGVVQTYNSSSSLNFSAEL